METALMFICFLIGGGVGFLYKPISMVFVLALFVLLSVIIAFLTNDLSWAALAADGWRLLALNGGYLVGALIRFVWSSAARSKGSAG
jgi:hypothetical protein